MEGDSVMNGWDESALAQIRETYQFLTPLLDKSLKLQPNPKPQKSRRMDTTTQGDPADQDQQGQGPQQLLKYLQVLGQLTLRHEHNWNLLQSTDCFILFFQQDQESALHGLLTATQEWHQQRQSNPMGMTTTLRQHLCQHLLQDLLNRTTKVSKSKPGEVLFQACRDRNLILEDMSWPFLRWDPTKKSLAVDKKKAVTMPKMLEHLQELIEEFRDPTLVVRFQGLSTSHAQATVPWKLQLNLRSNRPYDLMRELTHSSVWLLAGTSLKVHSMQQSGLAKQVQQLLPLHGKSKGMGKSRTKGKKTQES